MSNSVIDFDLLFGDIAERQPEFPKNKLFNRLANLGIHELFSGNGTRAFSLPFKYVDHLDESTLALAYFVNRLRKDPKASLKVHGSHRLQKGEDKTLSPWINERARLFLELQNILFLLRTVHRCNVEIRRIFILRDVSDIAFFNQSAITVLSEQVSLGIQIGFLFLNDFGESLSESEKFSRILRSSLTIEYDGGTVESDEGDSNFYFQGDTILDITRRNNIPYARGCLIKWAKDFNSIEFQKDKGDFTRADLVRHRSLFDNWKTFEQGTSREDSVLKIVNENEGRFTNDALLMLYSAYISGLGEKGSKGFLDRVCQTVITPDLVRLEKAMSAFDSSETTAICAVDATSVKNTLNVHESDPTYRQWIRRSINHVLRDSTLKRTIERIYIIDDTNPKKNEKSTLIRNLQYYLDFCALEIEELAEVSSRDGAEDFRITEGAPDWMGELWNSLADRIKVFVTTTTALARYKGHLASPKILSALVGFREKTFGRDHFIGELALLDFLFTDDMIYDFNNKRGDPGEMKFDAFLVRKNVDIESELSGIFRFPEMTNYLGDSADHVRLIRIRGYAQAILDYRRNYRDVMPMPRGKFTERQLERIASGRHDIPAGEFSNIESSLTEMRALIENRLFPILHEHAVLLFNELKTVSMPIKLFADPTRTRIEAVPPFNKNPFKIEMLTDAVLTTIPRNLVRDNPSK